MWIVAVRRFFFYQAEDGIRDYKVTGVQTCALPIFLPVFSSNWRINCIRFRSFGLERSCETLRCIRRTQFELAAVPGILKRYFRSEERRVGKGGRFRWWPYH